MTWPEVRCPDYLTRMREQLAEVDEWIKWGGSGERIHYPTCNLSGARGTADPLPACLIDQATTRRAGFAAGVPGLLQGSFTLIFYFSIITHPTAAEIEATVGDIIHDLTAQEDGHIWGDPDIGPASDPPPGARAATQDGVVADFRSVTVTLPWGAET